MTWSKRGQVTDAKIGVWCYDCTQACADPLRIKATFSIESQQGRTPRVRLGWQSIDGGSFWQATGPFG